MRGSPAKASTASEGLFVGVPVKLGSKGVEKVYEVAFTAEEKAALDKSAAAVKELVTVLEQKTK